MPPPQHFTATSAKSDLSDEEWHGIADLVMPHSGRGRMGRPVKNDRRRVVDAILYVGATGCQWRALPDRYPNWNTVHHYHLTWMRDGTWERVVARLSGRRSDADVRASILGLSSTFSPEGGNPGDYPVRASAYAPPAR